MSNKEMEGHMKRFALGLFCGVGIGAVGCLVSALIVGLRVRALDDETVVSPDHH